jgi:CheY-like chemotaxis protein
MLGAFSEEPQVMIIDDVPATRILLRDMLGEMGYATIVEAGTSHEALAQLKKKRAKLIICDYVMEDGSGLDFVRELRSHPYLEDVPVIIVSSCSDVPVIEAALELGADDYLVKPISFKLLSQKIRDVLQRRALLAK